VSLKNIHITYLRKFLDELILSKGILKIENPERVVEKIKMDYLIKLAFRFYSRMYGSEKYASYLKKSEKDLNLHSETQYQPIFKDIITNIKTTNEGNFLQCLNCGKDISQNDINEIGTDLPLCTTCYDNIGIEFDIWQRVFG